MSLFKYIFFITTDFLFDFLIFLLSCFALNHCKTVDLNDFTRIFQGLFFSVFKVEKDFTVAKQIN